MGGGLQQVYGAARQLSAADLIKDRGAFFGSILATLNHIVVGDTIWLKRFAAHPSCSTSLREVAELPNPISLNQILFHDFNSLYEHRNWLDGQIINWVRELSNADLNHILSYRILPEYGEFEQGI